MQVPRSTVITGSSGCPVACSTHPSSTCRTGSRLDGLAPEFLARRLDPCQQEEAGPVAHVGDKLEVAVGGGLGLVDRGLDEGVVDARTAGVDGDVAEERRVRTKGGGGADRPRTSMSFCTRSTGSEEHGAQVDEPADERKRDQERELAQEAAHGGVVAARALRMRRVDWTDARPVEIEPSLYAADFANLGTQIRGCSAPAPASSTSTSATAILSRRSRSGRSSLRSIAPLIHDAGGTLDCHLMVDDPVHHFEEIAASGGDSVTFHVEVVEDAAATLALAREQGLGAGVAFNPGTPVEEAAAAANLGADLCLCMSIVPGCSGQEFMDEAYARIERLRSLVDCRVQVDGGVKADNVRRRDAGADLLVVGSGIFGASDLTQAYDGLVQAVT